MLKSGTRSAVGCRPELAAERAWRWLGRYYVWTPAFAVVGWVLGLPPRAAFFDDVVLRYGYYGLCLLLGLLVRWRPRWAPVTGLLESSLAVILLLASVMLPIVWLPDQLASGSTPPQTAGLTEVASFVLFGTMAVLSFRLSERQLGRHHTPK